MTISKFISNVFRGNSKPKPRASVEAALAKGVDEEHKHRKDLKGIDLAHEALVQEAVQNSKDLKGLVDAGWNQVKREKFKQKVRSKVWQIVGDNSNCASVEMVEEITDRLVDASEADEYYKNMFDKEEA